MKYLLVFALAMVVFWLWRAARKSGSLNDSRAQQKSAGNTAKQPSVRQLDPNQPVTEIVACDVCQVHLPRTEALTGPGGIYCSEAHRRQAGC